MDRIGSPIHHQPRLRPLRLLMRAIHLWKLALSGPLGSIAFGQEAPIGLSHLNGGVACSSLNGCGWARLCGCNVSSSDIIICIYMYVYLCLYLHNYLYHCVHLYI